MLPLFQCFSFFVVLSTCFADKSKNKTVMPDKVKYAITELVHFNVSVSKYYDGKEDLSGEIVIGLFGKAVPMTVLNFVSLARGYTKKEKPLSFEHTVFHKIIPDFLIQGGDVQFKYSRRKLGTGSMSIYGEFFDDENFEIENQSAGWVGMANHGENTNGCQFFITLQRLKWLNGLNVFFGKVVQGMDFLQQLQTIEPELKSEGKTMQVVVAESSVTPVMAPWSLSKEEQETDGDVDIPFEI